jgi:Alpha/beta hydrolase domain
VDWRPWSPYGDSTHELKPDEVRKEKRQGGREMLPKQIYRNCVCVAVIAGAALLGWTLPTQARVTRIIIDAGPTSLSGQDIPYETLTGRAFGELDPADPHNTIITDIALAPRNGNGKVEYIASFFLVKPVDLTQASGLMWHDVPNRGGRITITADLRNSHDIGISSGWQGDNAGTGAANSATTVPANASTLAAVTPSTNEWVKTPVLSGVTGRIFGRIINRSGTNAPLNVMGNAIPYFPANSADNSDAVLTTRLHETIDGQVTPGETIPNSDWKFCYGASATFASPGSPSPGNPSTDLPVRVCLGNGRTFDPTKLYQLVYTVANPYVLGTGTAAFRDVASFFRYQAADDFGTPNPLAGAIRWAIIRGSSQSGNFTRHFIHLGFNQDEANRIVHEGAWPLIAGRRVANNSRWGQPDGVLELYQMGSEGPQWWVPWPDVARGNPTPKGILDRCTATNTCPKIIETFGGAEVFALKMTTSWVGTSADVDIPLPRNVRRYYLPSSTHGGGGGGFNEAIANVGAGCPGNNWGTGTLRGNPVPATQLVNRLRVALRAWVMNGTPPPPSRWPTIMGGNLVVPTKAAMGFPSSVPGIPDSIFLPENFVNPVFDYDFGPQFDNVDATGNPTIAPPLIKSVIPMKVPRVDADGNEIGGVPTVLRDAPLGTYLGWNITANLAATPFHAGEQCNYVGGMVPFFKTKADRVAAGDPRLSLEERYGTHDGYVAAVRAAADNAACQGYLLAGPAAASMGALCTGSIPPGFPDDWADLVNAAIASNVCNQPGDNGKCNPAAP